MIRLSMILLLLLISLLAVFRAPAYPLWLLSIIVQEFPWIFASLVLLLLVTGGYTGKYGLVNALASALALILYLSPVIRAYSVSRVLDRKLQYAFGNMFAPIDSTGSDSGRVRVKRDSALKADHGAPFRWQRMFSGKGGENIAARTLTYGSAGGAPLTLDWYPAQQPGLRPCVVVVHGGSWSSGDSRQLPELNSRLAKDGYTVVSINYRLAPHYQNPAQVEDLHAALDYLRSHATELSIDTNTFVLLGRSAGAQIALLAAYTLQDAAIKGVIDFYGPADMVWGYSVPSSPLIMDSRKVMSDYLGGPYPAVPQNYLNSSPVAFVTPHSAPTLIIHGQQDVLVAYEHSVRLQRKLADSGVRNYLLTLPWATHGFDFTLNGPGGQLSTYCVERFLEAICQKQ
jgi:acetyl esterase/lipase